MYSNLLTQTATRERLLFEDNTQEYDTDNAITFNCNIQHLQMEDVLEADGRFNKNWVMYCEYGTDVGSGDRITVDSRKFIVDKSGVNPYSMGSLSLTKVMLTEV